MTGRVFLFILGVVSITFAAKGLSHLSQWPVVYVLALIIGLIFAVVAVLPFFLEERWPRDKDLTTRETGDALSALYPVIKAHGEPAHADVDELVKAARDTTAERVLLRVNAKDSSDAPVLAVLTNRRFLVYRTRSQSFHILKMFYHAVLEKIPGVAQLAQLFEPFGDVYELLFRPPRKEFRKRMEHPDEELIAGTLPWKKTHDLSLAEVVKRSRQLGVRRAYGFAKTIVVEFVPRKFSQLFETPPTLEIEPRSVLVVANRLVDLFRAELQWPEDSVVRTGRMVIVRWPGQSAG